MYFFSKSKVAFFHDAVHGPRELTVRDPAWVAPPIVEGQTDYTQPATIQVPNPDCKIPEDAVEISDERHAELVAGIGEGMILAAAADDGTPTLLPVPSFLDGMTDEQKLDHMRNLRTRALTASDWTQMSDVDLPPATKAAWASYRQHLRDYPAKAKPGDPLPAAPGK